MNSFSPITLENISDVKNYLQADSSGFCDFTPFVALMWQGFYKTEYTVCDSVLYLKYTISQDSYYTAVTDDISKAVSALKSIPDFSRMTLVSEKNMQTLRDSGVFLKCQANEDYGDYVYSWESLTSLKGKKYAGQRNHINKFEALFPNWEYEEITPYNISHVGEFFDGIYSVTGDVSRDYESQMVRDYLKHYRDFPTEGGFVTANGKILAFAFGEIQNDTLFVHIEKADKTIPGAYPIIVREFARANPSRLVNREEDMGSEGLRKSKLSWHPCKILKKHDLVF